MHSSTASAILLASLLSTTSAFVPMQIKPLPTDFDTNVWTPLTTLAPEPAPTAASPLSQVTPRPTAEEIVNIVPVLDPNIIPDLKKRQGGQGVGQAIPQPVTQVSPITTYQIQLYRSGTQTQLNVVYTQTFAPIPDQWPSPTQAGTIGLGTIQGEIGVVKTKRSLPTQAPLAPMADITPTENASSDDRMPLLETLRKAGKEIKDEFEELVNKMKASFIEKETKLQATSSETTDAFSFGDSTQKDEPFSFGGPDDSNDHFSFGGTEESHDPFSFGSSTDELSEEDLLNLRPASRTHDNDARVLKAGTLAVIAVVIGTMCISYL